HQERGGDHRARGGEVDLAEPDTVHAPGLGHVGQLEGVVECRDRAGPATHLLDEEPEMHGERSYTTRLPGSAPDRRHGALWPRQPIWPTLGAGFGPIREGVAWHRKRPS